MISKEILIYGAGGAGRQLSFALSVDKNPDTAWRVEGFIDDTKRQGEIVNGIPVLGGIDYLKNYSGNIAVSIVDNPLVRRELILKIKKNENIKFPLVISSHAIVSPHVEWGKGCIVSPLDVIQPNCKFGDFVWINGQSRIGHDTIIGSYTTIFSGTLISGGVSIGSGCILGAGAIILAKRKIGDGSIIGAGALVTKDIPPGVITFGVPAKIIKKIFTFRP